MKKIICLIVVIAMIFVMGTVAFAAETTVTDEAGLKEALAAGGEIVLGSDITVSSILEIPAGKTVSIDLAGYDITATGIKYLIHVANTATLNISDSSADESGVIELTTTGNGSTINVEGNLNLYSGTISFDDDTYSGISYGVEVQPNAWGTEYTEGTVFNMYGGLIDSDTYGIRVASYSYEGYDNVSATFNMKGGEITSSWACVFVQQPNETHDKLTIKIEDGKLVNKDVYQAIQVYGPAATGTIGDVETPTNITVSGGEFLGSITVSNAIGDEMSFEISDGDFSMPPAEKLVKDGATITVGGVEYVKNGNVFDEPVAKIGTKNYATLKKALEAAAAGDEIVLLKDVTSSEILVIDKAITLNGNGKKLTSSAGRAINVSGANGVTIKDLTINASGERAINIIQNSTNVKVENVTATAANYVVNVAASAPNAVVTVEKSDLTGLNVVNVGAPSANVTVKDSKLTCNDQNDKENYAALALNKDAVNAKITATGVTFDIKGESRKAKNGAEGGVITIDGSTDEVKIDIARVGEGDYYYGFAALKEAIEYAVKKGEDVALLREIALAETLAIDEEVKIDLNGKKLSGKIEISATLTLKNATDEAVAGLTVVSSVEGKHVVCENGVYSLVSHTCADADKDHDCDYGCNKVYGEHKDANKDHNCDYGCSEKIGECTFGDEWVIIRNSTCEINGIERRYCEYGCGNYEQRYIRASHDYKEGVCESCGKVSGIDYIDGVSDSAKEENESNPNTGAPAVSIVPVLVAAAAVFFKKR